MVSIRELGTLLDDFGTAGATNPSLPRREIFVDGTKRLLRGFMPQPESKPETDGKSTIEVDRENLKYAPSQLNITIDASADGRLKVLHGDNVKAPPIVNAYINAGLSERSYLLYGREIGIEPLLIQLMRTDRDARLIYDQSAELGSRTVFDTVVRGTYNEPLVKPDTRFPSGIRTPMIYMAVLPRGGSSSGSNAASGEMFAMFCDEYGKAPFGIMYHPDIWQKHAIGQIGVSFPGREQYGFPGEVNSNGIKEVNGDISPWGRRRARQNIQLGLPPSPKTNSPTPPILLSEDMLGAAATAAWKTRESEKKPGSTSDNTLPPLIRFQMVDNVWKPIAN